MDKDRYLHYAGRVVAMKTILFIAVVSVFFYEEAWSVRKKREDFILNGNDAEPHQYPWAVRIEITKKYYGRKSICGGTLISNM